MESPPVYAILNTIGVRGDISMQMSSLTHSIEELLVICQRSIVSPDMIIAEASRIITSMNEKSLERKFIVEGYETLSILASGFMNNGYESFLKQYAERERIDHRTCGFSKKDELIRFCEFCVAYGDELLAEIRKTLADQLVLENSLTKNEICSLNHKKADPDKPGSISHTVQNQITEYIKLSLLVNSMKEFFKEYYKGLH